MRIDEAYLTHLTMEQPASDTGHCDAHLVQAALGDRRFFWLLYERYVDQIYTYALARTQSTTVADDIVSETMLSALERLDQFDASRGSFASWLFSIARNKVIDYQRAHRRFWRFLSRYTAQVAPAAEDDLVDRILRDEAIALVYTAFQKLSKRDQELIVLRYSAELSAREIGEILGITEVAARKRLSRARSRLAQHMQKE